VIGVTLQRPWLVAGLPRAMRCLSHAPFGAGYVMADRVVWREVRNADLGPDFDVGPWFAGEMAPFPGAVGMLTSRDVGTYRLASVEVEEVRASCLVTLGLSNAEAVGTRRPYHTADFGTINLCVAVDAGLTEAAQLEALCVAVQARTAGVMAAGLALETGLATGTGTDCVVLACDVGDVGFAGLHTAVGEAVGACVLAAVSGAARDWVEWRARV
jgi:adenosylcobinamide amidohydrolase